MNEAYRILSFSYIKTTNCTLSYESIVQGLKLKEKNHIYFDKRAAKESIYNLLAKGLPRIVESQIAFFHRKNCFSQL